MKSLDQTQKGIRANGKFLTSFRFANDIVIFSKSTSEAETMLHELNEGGKTALRMNRKKIQVIKNPQREGEEIKLDGSPITETTSSVYLGRPIKTMNYKNEEKGQKGSNTGRIQASQKKTPTK